MLIGCKAKDLHGSKELTNNLWFKGGEERVCIISILIALKQLPFLRHPDTHCRAVPKPKRQSPRDEKVDARGFSPPLANASAKQLHTRGVPVDAC
jgi:hypothetical protein